MARVPLLLELTGRRIVCAGGGTVAAAKVSPLAEAGAKVTVVAPQIVAALAATPGVDHVQREWREADLDGEVALVVAATDVAAVNAAVAAASAARGLWCLRVDDPASPVAVPAVVRRGELMLAVATGVPALTAAARRHLEASFPAEWGDATADLAALRKDPQIRSTLAGLTSEQRRARWRAAVAALLAE